MPDSEHNKQTKLIYKTHEPHSKYILTKIDVNHHKGNVESDESILVIQQKSIHSIEPKVKWQVVQIT